MILSLLIPKAILRPLAFPTIGSFSVNDSTSLNLGWTNADVSAKTEIWRNGALITTRNAGVSNYTDTGLSGGVTYNYQIRHVKGTPITQWSSLSVVFPAYTAPEAPSSLIAGSTGSTVNLTWSNPNPALETRVYQGASLITTVAAGVAFYDHTGVSDGNYNYTVRAWDGANLSSPSNTANVDVTLVDPPTGATVSVSTDDVTIDWTYADVLLQTKVYRDGVLIATKSAGVQQHIDSNVANGTYTYTLKHFDGTNLSAPASTTPSTGTVAYVPAPSGLGLTNAVYADRVTVSWTNAGAYTTQVWRDSGAGFTQIASLPPGTTSHDDDTVAMGVEYDYKVLHTVGGVNSAFSSPQTITTAVPAFSSASIDPSWSTNKFVVSFEVTIMPKDGTVTFDEWSDDTSLNGGGGASGSIGSPYQFDPEGYVITKLGPEFGNIAVTTLAIRDSGGNLVASENIDSDFAYDSDGV